MVKATIPHRAVYAIKCDDGRCYVGASKNVRFRWYEHRSDLKRGVHHSPKLQKAWAALGAPAFAFVVLETIDSPDIMIEREQYWIDRLSAARDGFNVAPFAGGSSLGIVRSQEVRARVSAAHIGVQPGERNPASKLTDAAVRSIRADIRAGELHRVIAAKHGVARTVIGKIGQGQIWKHVT